MGSDPTFPEDRRSTLTSGERREPLALLKILALGRRQAEEGKLVPAAEAVRRAREAIARRR